MFGLVYLQCWTCFLIRDNRCFGILSPLSKIIRLISCIPASGIFVIESPIKTPYLTRRPNKPPAMQPHEVARAKVHGTMDILCYLQVRCEHTIWPGPVIKSSTYYSWAQGARASATSSGGTDLGISHKWREVKSEVTAGKRPGKPSFRSRLISPFCRIKWNVRQTF